MATITIREAQTRLDARAHELAAEAREINHLIREQTRDQAVAANAAEHTAAVTGACRRCFTAHAGER